MARTDLLSLRPEGLYCAAGDFFVDPWLPVERAVITHAHADHARPGHKTDHADFQELNQAIEATGAERVLVTHGSTNVLARWLTERGFQSEVLPTEFGDDAHDEDAAL